MQYYIYRPEMNSIDYIVIQGFIPGLVQNILLKKNNGADYYIPVAKT